MRVSTVPALASITADPRAAREALGHVDRRQSGTRTVAMVVSNSGGNMTIMGAPDAGSISATANGIKIAKGRRWYGMKASATTNGIAVGGWAPAGANTAFWSTDSGLTWEVVFCIMIPSATTLSKVRLWCGLRQTGGNHPNTAEGSDTHLAARFDGVGGDTTWVASARSASGAGNQTTSATSGPTVATDTAYALRLRWSGTAFTLQVATIGSDGSIGEYGTAVSITDDLPASSVGLQWCIGCFQDSTPATAQEIYIGDTDAVVGVL